MEHKIFQHYAFMPIFDRFKDTHPEIISENSDDHILTNGSLKKSIYDWLYVVFNTRPTAKHYSLDSDHNSEATEKLPIYFGLSDFAWFDTTHHLNSSSIALAIEKVIIKYEPRLTNVNVLILRKDTHNMGLNIQINATIQLAGYQERISIPLTIDNIFKRL